MRIGVHQEATAQVTGRVLMVLARPGHLVSSRMGAEDESILLRSRGGELLEDQACVRHKIPSPLCPQPWGPLLGLLLSKRQAES